MITNLVRKEIEMLTPVQWGEYEKKSMRLFWGENLLELPQKMMQNIISDIKNVNQYPDPNQVNLRNVLALYNDITPEQLIIGNGSDSLIELIAKTFIEANDEILIPVPSFITYTNVSKLMGGVVRYVDLEKNFSLNIGKLIKNVSENCKLIFIANPNNPTGNYLVNIRDVDKLLRSFKGVVIIDECYYEIGGYSVKKLIDKYDRLIVLRSFSKVFGLAGLRVGYAMASKETIKIIKKVQQLPQPFEVNTIAQTAAIESLKWKNELLTQFLLNKRNFINKLIKIPKINVIETKTTFILIDLVKTKKKAFKIVLDLQQYNIFTKDCSTYSNFSQYILYLGIPAKNDIDFVAAKLKEVLK